MAGMKVRSFGSGSTRCRQPPGLERLAPQDAEREAECEMALDFESVVDGAHLPVLCSTG
jgi:hypothetical protein